MTTLVGELRYAIRALQRSPAFATTAGLTLALAIWTNTTVLSVLDRVLLRPLPYADAERLVSVFEKSRQGEMRLASYPTFLDWQRQARAFDGLGFARGSTGILQTEEGPERLTVAHVTPGYFRVLGARPRFGRVFLSDEEQGQGRDVAVLSRTLWERRFGGDRSIIGRTITLDSAAVTVVGVMPPGVVYPPWADLWRPIRSVLATDPALTRRTVHSDSRVIARFRPGTSREAALAELSTIQAQLAAAYPDPSGAWTSAEFVPLQDELVGEIGRSSLLVLGGSVVLVLLIACMNIASLSLVRASVRQRELAIRAALGASRGRLMRQLLTESVVLGLAAGAVGLLLTVWTIRALRAAQPPGLPRAAELAVDFRVLGFALVLSLVASILFGIAPALRGNVDSFSESLRDGRHAVAGGQRGARLRSIFTAAQVGIALTLLVGAGLLIQSFRRLQRVELGFEPERLVTFRIFPPGSKYSAAPQAAALYRRILESVATVPGVEAAALINHPPLGPSFIPTKIVVPGRAAGASDEDVALYKTVSAEYLGTTGMRLLQGRWFSGADIAAPGSGIVVSETVARRYWPNENPIGKPITVFRSSQARPEFGQPDASIVIGVVRDVRHFGLAQAPTPEVYIPYTRETWPHMALVVRTASDPRLTISALRRAVLAVDPAIPVAGSSQLAGFQPMSRFLSQSLATRRYATGLLVGFATCALLLAIVGVYGVIAYSVSQRAHEIGIRMALGAARRHVLAMVLGQGARLVLVGTVLGILGAIALTRVLKSLLYNTSPTDPTTFFVVAAIVIATALVASVIPARRAAWTDPTLSLRSE